MVSWTEAEVLAHNARHATPAERERKALAAELDDERQLHAQIANWLRVKGVRAVVHSRMDKRATQHPGTADFCFAVRGQAVAVEAKVAGRQPTPGQ